MAQRTTNESIVGEVLGRNMAIKCLRKQLKQNGIRIDFKTLFESGQPYLLIALFFDPVPADDGSQKFLCTPKPDFYGLVKKPDLVAGFPQLLPKAPEEAFGRNPAIAFLRRHLKKNGIRIDFKAIFANRQSYELLAVFFTQTPADDGSQKFLCTAKPDFYGLVKKPDLVAGFPQLLPKAPAEVIIPAFLLRNHEAPAQTAQACAAA